MIGQTVEKIEELLGATGAILCMPAILMTRLHPTHRGAETVALSLGPFPRLAQNEERECAGCEARTGGRMEEEGALAMSVAPEYRIL